MLAPMLSLVAVRAPGGQVHELGHGALIGRLWSADLHLNDARVSEAHAMISLRGRDVRLLALRGRFAVDGRWLSDVVLAPGLVVSLAKGVAIEVVTVHVPDQVLAIEADGLSQQVLTGVTSVYGGATPRLVSGWEADAHAHLWPTGEAWMRGPGEPVPVDDGDHFTAGGTTFRAVRQRTQGVSPTVADPDYARPLTITARFDTVHLAREGEAVVVVTGHAARVMSELVATRTAVAWDVLARQCWADTDRDALRHRWDMLLRRLRIKLAAHGVRADLLRADGFGLIELVLGPGDVLVDDT